MKNSAESLSRYTENTRVSWFSAFKRSWQSALRIDRSQITAVQAIRGTIGFVLPLALGVATGHIVEGVSLAGGAATLGAVGLTYTYRARTRTLLLACLAIACSAFVGSLVGRIDWLAILVLGLWGFGAGLLASISQVILVIGIQAVIALIILSHFALDPFQAALQALLMLAGALFQTLLASIPFPRQQAIPERTALADVYQKLAAYTDSSTEEQNRYAVRDALVKAYPTVHDTSVRNQQGKIFVTLFEQAERLRLLVIALTRLLRDLPQETSAQKACHTYVVQMLQASAGILRHLANELAFARKTTDGRAQFEQVEHALTALHQQDAPVANEKAALQIVTYCDLLYEQLSSAKQLVEMRRNRQQRSSIEVPVPPQQHVHWRDLWATVRANFTLRSVYFRHALRQGVTLAIATALYRYTPLLAARGYWIALTALLVLRPDFTTTFTRGIARLLGTLVGVVLTTLLVATLAPAREILVLLDALAAYLAFSFLLANYAIFSAFITVEVVFLLTFVEPQPLVTSADRALNTIIGGILALVMYLLWPTWEHPRVLHNIANRLEALRIYFVAVMHAYADPEKYNVYDIDALRMNARLTRSNADISVQRSQQEPETRGTHRVDPELTEGFLIASDMIAQSILALEAFLVDNPAQHTLPETLAFTKTVDTALHLLATAIDKEQPLKDFPDVQAALTQLEHVNASTSSAPITLRFVQTEAKNIVQGIGTMQQLLVTRVQEDTQS